MNEEDEGQKREVGESVALNEKEKATKERVRKEKSGGVQG